MSIFRSPLLRGLATIVAIFSGVATAQTASAADFTWNVLGGGSQNWQDAANWVTATGTYPNSTSENADFRVALAGNLSVDVGSSGTVTTGSIGFGGTGSAVTTDITSTGGALVLNNVSTNGLLVSQGVAGSVNKISAPLILGKTTQFDAASTRALSITGTIGQVGASQVLYNNATALTLAIGNGAGSQIQLYDSTLGVGTARSFEFRNLNSTATGGISQATTVNSVWVGTGNIAFGADSNSRNAGMTYTLLQSQSITSSATTGRQTFILGADNPFGLGVVTHNNSSQTNWGGIWKSTDDSRVVGNSRIVYSNNFSVAGDYSMTFTGTFGQTANKNFGNNLATGKTLTLSGPIYPNATTTVNSSTFTLTIDGTGRTVMSGVVNNNAYDNNVLGHVKTLGSGRLEVTNPANTISGTWLTNGGLIVFGTQGAYGATSGGAAGSGSVIVSSTAGGVSYAPGTADAGFVTFASKLIGGVGYLALPASDAASNLDFSGSGALATAPNLSVTGDGVMAYTGVVTPGAAGYNWGGPQGQLTLGSNAGTGANPVTYTNGGSVVVNGSPDYTGVTTIKGVQYASAQVYITNGQNTNGTQNFNLPTTLEVTSLGIAGSASSLGASSSDASNLVIDRATLKVNSASATSTDRLFTVGPAGATIESAGAGLVTLGSGGGANVGPSSAATLTLAGAGDGVLGSILADGAAALSLTKTGAGTWTLNGINTYTGATTVSAGKLVVNGALGSGTLTVASGAAIGGSGTLTSISFAAGSTLTFNPTNPLTVSSTATFVSPSTFGVDDIIGLSSSTPEGTYTLIAGNVNTTGLANFGSANAYDLGSGKSAYFQSGSLQLVVVPEPATMLAGLAGAGVFLLIRRRSRD